MLLLFLILPLFLAFLVLTPGVSALTDAQRDNAYAANYSIYRNAVLHYVQTNKSFSGTVPDTSLQLPGGYTKTVNWSNDVTSGAVTVFGVIPAPYSAQDVMWHAVEINGHTVSIGVNQAGRLLSPIAGYTVTLPNTVPPGAITSWDKIT